MRTKIRRALVTMTVCAASVAATSVIAAESRTCPLAPRSITAERDAQRRLADEARVVDWLAHRILADVADPDVVLDISAAEVREATGVDASTLDADRLRSRVSMKLRELAVGPTEGAPGEPSGFAPVTTPKPAAPCTGPARAAAPAADATRAADATPAAEAAPSAEATPTAAATPAAGATPAASATPAAGATPTASATPAADATPAASATPTAEGTPASAAGGGLRRAADDSSTGRAASVR